MTKNTTPLESKEQANFVRWLDERGIKLFSATAQSTFTNWKGINKNIAAGVRKGIPDLIICLPSIQTKTKKNILCFVEMKRIKGGRVGKEQKEWVDFINSVDGDIEATICYGAEEAKIYIDNLIKPKKIDERPIEEQEWFMDQ